MKYCLLLSIVVIGLCIPVISCGMLDSAFSGNEEVTLILPALPPAAERAGLPGPVWKVRWYTEGTTRHERTIEDKAFVLTLEKGQFTPILAELDNPDPRYGPYPVAGSIYPALAVSSLETAELPANWSGGAAALAAEQALLSAYGGSETAVIILSRFNWSRLVREINGMTYPEYIDYTRLVPAILSGTFRVYDIKTRPLFAYRIVLQKHTPAPGEEFLSLWPGRSAFVWPGEEGVSVELADGMNRFYGTTGCITVQTGGQIADNTFFTPYSLQEDDSSGTVKWYENVRHGDCLHHVPDLVQTAHNHPRIR